MGICLGKNVNRSFKQRYWPYQLCLLIIYRARNPFKNTNYELNFVEFVMQNRGIQVKVKYLNHFCLVCQSHLFWCTSFHWQYIQFLFFFSQVTPFCPSDWRVRAQGGYFHPFKLCSLLSLLITDILLL